MNETIQNLMREATRLTQSGNLKEATAVIQRALGSARSAQMPPASALSPPSQTILDGCVLEAAPIREPQGEFAEGRHTDASLTRHYKLYIPPGAVGAAGKNLPLLVMLHGCTQNPDDFAAGTGMNALAREQGFYVLYPAQSADANQQRCWNWFKHTHQSRGRGEAALLASMTLSIMQQHRIDPRRVYVAGLSAGGAMAANVAAAYPEIYAAAGVHSGLAVGAASNVSEALAAMRSGGKGCAKRSGVGDKAADHARLARAVPTIVFHGERDHTVHPRNGEQVIGAVQGSASQRVEHGVSSGGRRFTRTVYGERNGIDSNDAGSTVAEHWLVHGAGHAWSGGDVNGSYTDPAGPDASREMLRFFLAHNLPEN